MSLLPNKFTELLFKPKWQHKDAAIRRIAVQEAQHQALLHELPRIAREDEDHRVRLAALRRVNDFSLYRDRAGNDPDPALRSVARTQYLGMLCGELPAEIETNARLRELGIIEINEDIEHIAIRAKDVVLRRAAFERVTRASLIADRAVSDPDPGLRQTALERINDAAVLSRIAEKTRKTDKLISRLARERADLQRIASGDNNPIVARAQALCERIEALLRTSSGTRNDDLAQIELAWSAVSAQTPESFCQRYAVAHTLLAQGSDRAANRFVVVEEIVSPELIETSAESKIAAEAQTLSEPVISAEMQADALLARANFDAALAKARDETQRERDQHQALLGELREQVERYSGALEAGDTSTAQRSRSVITEQRKRLRDVPAAIVQTLLQHENRFAELAQWQHWANDKRRRQLVEDMETLLGAGLHPDAVATKVRDARNEWQKLDTAEDLSDQAAAQGIAKRFQALCHQALKPTRLYFDKREEVRKSHQQEIEVLLARTDAIAPENDDWKLIATMRRDTVLALRGELDSVDPRQRTQLAKRLKDAIARLAAMTDAHELTVEQSKSALIAKATSAGANPDAANAPREVRELQKRWQAAGVGKRRTDQKQWEQFRMACDAVFGNLDQAKQQRESAHVALQTQAAALVDELDGLRDSLAQGNAEARTRQREIDTQWRELSNVERTLQTRYHAALEAAQAAGEQQQRARRLSRYTNADARYAVLFDLENGRLTAAAAQASWDGLPAATREFSAAMSPRFENALHHSEHGSAAESDAEQRTEQARDLLIRIEFIAGLESPPQDRQRRMDYQVSRLSARLRGDNVGNVEVELGSWLSEWYAVGALPTDQAADLHTRYARALQTLLGQLP
jgi:exonuclease SbcC